MSDKASLAVSVGLPDSMAQVERELLQRGFKEVIADPEALMDGQYSKRKLVEVFDLFDPATASVMIAWRCQYNEQRTHATPSHDEAKNHGEEQEWH